MIELGDTVEEYEVAVVAMVPVKRLVRVKARSDSHARMVASEQVQREAEAGTVSQWSVPQRSRSEVDSDQELLGPLIDVHPEAIQPPFYSGMCPTIVGQ